MNQAYLRTANQEVYRRFPEFSGVKPKVQEQLTPQNSVTYLVTYNCKVSAPGGRSMNRWVRVVINEQGKIIKLSTSR